MSRSNKKGPYVAPHIFDQFCQQGPLKKKTIFKIWSRSTTILSNMVGHTFAIYNGRQHIPLFVTEQCVGHKFGEFAPTRTFYSHTNKDKKGKQHGGKGSTKKVR
jgi:small subunit ribosomal protein S19